MPDLVCYKPRHELVVIEAMSYRGQTWLDKNMEMGDKRFLVVQASLLEDLLKVFEEAGLEVDSR